MIDISFIKSVLNYNPDTGVLTWKTRCEKDTKMLENFSVRAIRGFNSRFAGKEAGHILPLGYKKVYLSFKGKPLSLLSHHIAWVFMTGKFPKDLIDHKDRNPSNNSWENLREVSRTINNLNTKVRKNSSTGVKGVSYRKKNCEWVVSFFIEGKPREIYRSKDFFEAVCVRKSLDNKYDLEHSRDIRKFIKTPPLVPKYIHAPKVKVRLLPSGNFQAYFYRKNTSGSKTIYKGLGTYSDFFEACCVAKSAEIESGNMYDAVKSKVVSLVEIRR